MAGHTAVDDKGVSADGSAAEEEARLTDAVKHHCRDRNRRPSEPAGACMFPTVGGCSLREHGLM